MRLFVTLAILLTAPTIAFGDMVDFETTINSAPFSSAGGTYTLTRTFTVQGVTFDATLVVLGSGLGSDDVSVNVAGLGVGANEEINALESLTYQAPDIDVITAGGTVQFTGFSAVRFSEFDPSDDAIFNGGAGNVTLDDSDLTMSEYTFANTQSFSIRGGTDSAFNLDMVTANFTASFTAVPEPSSICLAAGLCPLLMRRRRRPSMTRARV